MTSNTARLLPSYGRRHGRALKAGKRALIEEKLRQYLLDIDSLQAFILSKQKCFLEIGFGGGEHLAAQASAVQNACFIGCEVYENGVANLIRLAGQEKLSNLRIFSDDARLLLPHVPSASLEGIFLLFPDPWPKLRHHKRRIVSQTFLDEVYRLLKPGGFFRFATDHTNYAEWALVHLLYHSGFRWRSENWDDAPGDHTETRYEHKAKAQAKRIYFLEWHRE